MIICNIFTVKRRIDLSNILNDLITQVHNLNQRFMSIQFKHLLSDKNPYELSNNKIVK